MSFEMTFEEPIVGDCLILSWMEFHTVGAAKLKALRPMAVVVKGTCSRLCEEERRSLDGALRLIVSVRTSVCLSVTSRHCTKWLNAGSRTNTKWVCVCVCIRLRISPPRIKVAASYFARRFIGVVTISEFYVLCDALS